LENFLVEAVSCKAVTNYGWHIFRLWQVIGLCLRCYQERKDRRHWESLGSIQKERLSLSLTQWKI